MTMPAGAQISGYLIERVLGAGGMGTVYLARHPTLPRSVALKVLSAELSADPEFQVRFRREADLAASLEHPNIVRVYTRGQSEDGRLWIAMQFIDGTDAGALAEHGPLPVDRALHIIAEVAKALDFAHSRKLLHRDIKPANFLLAGEPGPHERVLLADFGIARALEEATRLTATGSMMATVAYAAPEAIEGQPLDHRADLYSLGCALFRLLAGRTPFQDAGTMSAVMMAHLTRPVPDITDFVPQLPPAINTVLAIAMAKNRADRFDSARELYAAAQAALLHNQLPTRSAPEAVSTVVPGPSPVPTLQARADGRLSSAITRLVKTKKNGRRSWPTGVGVFAALGLVTALVVASTSDDTPPYPLQSFNHTFGTTEIDHRPHAVAALTLADTDVAISLGVQPVAYSTSGRDTTPAWLASRIHGHPATLSDTDVAAVKHARPDLIIDTGNLTEAQYDQLTAVAPTITRPATLSKAVDPAARLSWLGSVLGEQSAADALREQLDNEQTQLRAKYPKLAGHSVGVFGLSDDGLTALLSNSAPATYLSGLGLTYNEKLQTGSDGAPEKPMSRKDIWTYRTDIAVVLRTDKLAGSGGFFGVPAGFESLPGLVVIVDDPATIAALTSCGPIATRYLNNTLVPAMMDELS